MMMMMMTMTTMKEEEEEERVVTITAVCIETRCARNGAGWHAPTFPN